MSRDTQPRAPLLHATALSVAFGDAPILQGLDVALRAGEPLLVRGPSGGGKTTLLRSLACLQPLTAGRLELHGGPDPVVDAPGYRRRVVYVGQQPALHAGTVADNLRRPFAFASVAPAFNESQARSLLASLNLADSLERRARDLSVGQQQRVCLARALLIEPTVLLLDEPTSALDDAAAARVQTLVAEWLGAAERSFVLVTHSAERLASLCTTSLQIPMPGGGGDA